MTKINLNNQLPHWIDGRAAPGTSGRFGEVFNPASGEMIRAVPFADRSEVDATVAAAVRAFAGWAATPAPKRAGILYRMRELLVQNSARLMQIIGEEHGKTSADARGEIMRAIEVVEFACGIPYLMRGDHNANVAGQIDVFSIREPVGVVAGISPFNFPMMVPLWMGALAVASGCSFINKPSERDPSAALLIAELWQAAGLPDGVWNVLNGDKATVDALLEHPDVPAVSFVGSTPVAEAIYRGASYHGKRVQAFGGAKNHMVVMPDADLDQVTDALLSAGYGSAGERCMAISVAVPVGEETADALVARLAPRVRELNLGVCSDPKADFGPLISAQAKRRVEDLIESGVEQGAQLVVDGRGATVSGHEHGYFVGPTLFDRVTRAMEIYRNEIFGPVLIVVRVADFATAIELIGANEYGNGVALFTRDGDLAQEFTRRVDVGMIGINVPIPVPMAFHHFGGSKRSKFGDTQMYGPDAVKFFTKLKTVSQRWPSSIRKGASLAFAPGR